MASGELSERDAAIVAARLRGATWPAIAREQGLSERHCRRLFGAADRRRVLADDPVLEDDLAEILRTLGEDSARHRRRAAETRNQGAQLAALRRSLRATKARIGLLAAAGLLPRAAGGRLFGGTARSRSWTTW